MKKYIYSERADLFDPNIYIEFLFEIKGNPSIQMIEKAIKKAYYANEVTMSKIVIYANGSAAYEPVEECGCTVTVTNQEWQAIIKANEKIPFAIERGEMIRSFIIQSEHKIFILIMAHHLAGDGKSIVYFIEDFMNALSGNKINKKPMVLFTKPLLSNICGISPVMKLYASYFNRKWKKYNKRFSIEDYYTIHNTYWKSHESVILQQRYTIEEFSSLHQKAKENHVTINNLIIAAFQKANLTYKNVGIAVDGRINENRSISNQATGISIKYNYLPKKTIFENAAEIQKKVQRKIKNSSMKYFILQFMPLLSPSLVDSILFYTYGLYLNPVSRKIADVIGYTYKKENLLSITNLTKLNIPQKYESFEIKNIIFIPPVISYGKRIIGVVSDEYGMNITYHFMNELNEINEKAYFDLANTNLQKIIDSNR